MGGWIWHPSDHGYLNVIKARSFRTRLDKFVPIHQRSRLDRNILTVNCARAAFGGIQRCVAGVCVQARWQDYSA